MEIERPLKRQVGVRIETRNVKIHGHEFTIFVTNGSTTFTISLTKQELFTITQDAIQLFVTHAS